jgi:hypothetical protein
MIGIIGQGLVATAIGQQCGGTIYGRRHSLGMEHYSTVIIAAPTGNRLAVSADPSLDRLDCENILEKISLVRYERLVHVSTVDIYPDKTSLDSQPGSEPVRPGYGRNRWWLEKEISQLPRSHVVRLPSLCDPTICKNILYDIKHSVWLDKISLQSSLQWYPLCRIWRDIVWVIDHQIDCFNLVSAPIANRQIVKKFRPDLINLLRLNDVTPMIYDVHSGKDQYWINDHEIWMKFHEYFRD